MENYTLEILLQIIGTLTFWTIVFISLKHKEEIKKSKNEYSL